eukprot:scaffold5170_cov200-Alexandrium_tamarense.AAC.12
MFKEIKSKQGTWCFVLHRLCAARSSLTYLYISYISVWRGGSSVFVRAVLTVLGEADKRVSYVCDSFSGLPPWDRSLDSFFNETKPPLSKKIEKLSVIRLDGDMYESAVDVLYHLYDKLSIGGCVIKDDWFGFPSKTACDDFFEVHGIQPNIVSIDQLSAYWKKTEDVDIQYWRYEQTSSKRIRLRWC